MLGKAMSMLRELLLVLASSGAAATLLPPSR